MDPIHFLTDKTQTVAATAGFNLAGWVMDSNNIIYIIAIIIFLILMIKALLGPSIKRRGF